MNLIKEYYHATVIDTTLNVVNSRIESVRSKNITKTSLRVYKDQRIGVAGAIGSYKEDELLKEAMEALDRGIDYPVAPSSQLTMTQDLRKPLIAPQDLVTEFGQLLESLRELQPNYIFSNKMSLSERSNILYNDAGLKLEYADRTISAGLIFKEKSSTSVFDGAVGFRERKYDRKLILDEFNLILNAYSEKVSLPPNGRYPVVFLTEDAPVGKFITGLKADVLAKGGSLFSEKIGQRLFNEAFTFGQCLDPQEVYLSPFFDAEGVVNNGYTYNLIEDGVIKAPYCDKKTAHKFGFAPSGSAAAAYDGVPQTALLHPTIKKCGKSFKELLGGQTGIFVMMAAGGDFTPQGEYATPVQVALLTDGERLLGRLPEFNLSSHVYDMFGQGFRGVTDRTFLPFSGDSMAVLEMNIAAP
jgi:PmbA protein